MIFFCNNHTSRRRVELGSAGTATLGSVCFQCHWTTLSSAVSIVGKIMGSSSFSSLVGRFITGVTVAVLPGCRVTVSLIGNRGGGSLDGEGPRLGLLAGGVRGVGGVGNDLGAVKNDVSSVPKELDVSGDHLPTVCSSASGSSSSSSCLRKQHSFPQ